MDILDKNQLKAFIIDTYVFLNNHRVNSDGTYENDITDQYSRANLLQRCTEIMDKLNEDNGNDDTFAGGGDLDDCYLEMNSKINYDEDIKCCNNKSPDDDKILLGQEMNSTEQSYLSLIALSSNNSLENKNKITVVNNGNDDDDGNDFDANSIPCPYSGLPASQLATKNSQKFDFINRIERRLFFEQSKKYYAGVLTKWLLLYTNGLSDLKPATYLYINRNVTIDNLCESNKKKLYLFQINYFNNKKYLFQTQTENDLHDWINVLNEMRLLNHRDEINISLPLHNLSIRKLPTPPIIDPDASLHDGNNCTSTTVSSTSISDQHVNNCRFSSDDIYEEPKSLFDYNNLSVCDNKMICCVNGKEIEYDIPKSKKLMTQQVNANKINDVNEPAAQDDENYELIELSKMREQINYDLKEKPILPIKKSCSNQIPTRQINSNTTSSNVRTPVKQWLINRLTITSSNRETLSNASITPPPKTFIGPTKSAHRMTKNPTGIFVEKLPPKGGKINMIINQLEANSRIPISKNLCDRRNT